VNTCGYDPFVVFVSPRDLTDMRYASRSVTAERTGVPTMCLPYY